MGVLNSKNLFLTILEARKSEIKVAGDLVTSESSLPGAGLQSAFLLCPHMSKEKE